MEKLIFSSLVCTALGAFFRCAHCRGVQRVLVLPSPRWPSNRQTCVETVLLAGKHVCPLHTSAHPPRKSKGPLASFGRTLLVTVFDKNESSPLGRKRKQNPTDPRKQGDLVLAFFWVFHVSINVRGKPFALLKFCYPWECSAYLNLLTP